MTHAPGGADVELSQGGSSGVRIKHGMFFYTTKNNFRSHWYKNYLIRCMYVACDEISSLQWRAEFSTETNYNLYLIIFCCWIFVLCVCFMFFAHEYFFHFIICLENSLIFNEVFLEARTQHDALYACEHLYTLVYVCVRLCTCVKTCVQEPK